MCHSQVVEIVFFFFFSSRRRHTRWTGDWSSDVCSSDLIPVAGTRPRKTVSLMGAYPLPEWPPRAVGVVPLPRGAPPVGGRGAGHDSTMGPRATLERKSWGRHTDRKSVV